MAGTTLRGIGDDEEEEEEGEKTPPPPSAAQDEHQMLSGPTVVDSAKVAESLKKLRSLDDSPKTPPPGVIPTSAPVTNATLLGMSLGPPVKPAPAPAVGSTTLFGIGAPVLTGHPGSGPLSTTSTLAGVVAPVAGEADATIPTNAVSGTIERDTRGTMMGHDRHIGDRLPQVESGRVIAERAVSGEFSGGERHFFESEPINTEFEPEFKPNPYARVGVGLAVVGVFVAAVWGYARYRSSEPAPTEAQAPPPSAAPAPVETPPPVAATPTPPVTAQEPTPAPAPAAAQEPPNQAVAPPAPAPAAVAAVPMPESTPAPESKPAPTEAPPAIIEPPPAPKHPVHEAVAKSVAAPIKTPASKDADKPKARAAATAEHPDRPHVAKEKVPILEPAAVGAPPRRAPIRPVTSLDSPPATHPPAAKAPATPMATGMKPAVRPAPSVTPGTQLPVPKPKSAKRGGEDDPDGTLPLSID
ncbi:MAG TPA: hypothetical protein VH374_11510 [Polyangia bacterium]|jgi:hypothetical protein|nr:hypothetical protein [Polyangia bacterium]